MIKIDGSEIDINELTFRPCMKHVEIYSTNGEIELDGQIVNGQYYYILREDDNLSLISRREFNKKYEFSSFYVKLN